MTAILDCPPSERLTLAQLAREQGVSPPTVWRWAVRGVAGVKLPRVYIGSKPYTSRPIFRAWCDDVTRAKNGEVVTSTTRTNKPRERDIKAAEDDLRREGIL